MPNLRQLRHVAALAEHRNYRRAATALALTQSALTQSIQRLEEEYGVRLFERSKRSVEPTPYGLLLIDIARQTQGQLVNFEREVALMKNLRSGRLIIGADTLVAEPILGPAMARIFNVHPDLRFTIRVGAYDTLLNDLLERRIDVYIGSPPKVGNDNLRIVEFPLPRIVVACKPDHPLLEIPRPTVQDCLAYPIAAPPRPAWTYSWLADELGGETFRTNPEYQPYFLESDDYGVIKWLVRHTHVITTILPDCIAMEIANGSLCSFPLESLDFSPPAIIATLAERSLPAMATILIDTILEQAASQDGCAARLS